MVRRRVCFVLALALACAPRASAQTVAVAQLSGSVADEQGGALPGAEVKVTQIDTGMTRFVITGADGAYVFTNLPVGPYKLAAKLTGFSLFEQTGIVLTVGQARSVNITRNSRRAWGASRNRLNSSNWDDTDFRRMS